MLTSYEKKAEYLKNLGYTYDPVVDGWVINIRKKRIPDSLVCKSSMSFDEFIMQISQYIPKNLLIIQPNRKPNVEFKTPKIIEDGVQREDALDHRLPGSFGTGKRR